MSYDRALVALQAKLYKQAAEYAKQELQGNPGHLPSMRILAASLYLLQRLNEAERVLRDILAIDPNYAQGFYLLSCVYSSRIKPEETQYYAKQALLLAPDNAHYVAQLARSELMKANWQLGIDLLDKALSLEPSNMTALVLKAYALRSVGRFADAEAVTKSALKIDPECSDLHQESGFINMRFEPALAEEHFREALRKNPNDKVSQKALREARAQSTWYYRIIRRVFKVDILLPYYLVYYIAHFSFVDKHPFMPDKDYDIMMCFLLCAPVLICLTAMFIGWVYYMVMLMFGVDLHKIKSKGTEKRREPARDNKANESREDLEKLEDEPFEPYPMPSRYAASADAVIGADGVPSKTADANDPSGNSVHSTGQSAFQEKQESPSKVRNAPQIVQFLKMNTQPYVWLILVFVFLRFIAALVQGIN